jgi:glycine/D-amino acid oxidase-like deaminating enzyme
MQTVRQTDEGTLMIGDSQEEVGPDPTATRDVTAVLAHRAMRIFPQLAQLNVVRSWGCLRVMTKDGFPIYEESSSCPGAFNVSVHSGVTLAAAHALFLAPQIADGRLLPQDFAPFSTSRFRGTPNVQALAA